MVAIAISLRSDRRLFPGSCCSCWPRLGWTRLCACPPLCVWDYFFRVPSQSGRSGLRLARMIDVLMACVTLLFTPVTPVRKVNSEAWGCGCQLTPRPGRCCFRAFNFNRWEEKPPHPAPHHGSNVLCFLAAQRIHPEGRFYSALSSDRPSFPWHSQDSGEVGWTQRAQGSRQPGCPSHRPGDCGQFTLCSPSLPPAKGTAMGTPSQTPRGLCWPLGPGSDEALGGLFPWKALRHAHPHPSPTALITWA